MLSGYKSSQFWSHFSVLSHMLESLHFTSLQLLKEFFMANYSIKNLLNLEEKGLVLSPSQPSSSQEQASAALPLAASAYWPIPEYLYTLPPSQQLLSTPDSAGLQQTAVGPESPSSDQTEEELELLPSQSSPEEEPRRKRKRSWKTACSKLLSSAV